MVYIKTLDLFGVEISANDLADIIWQGVDKMGIEANEPTTCEARRDFLNHRIQQAIEVHNALLENGVTNE